MPARPNEAPAPVECPSCGATEFAPDARRCARCGFVVRDPGGVPYVQQVFAQKRGWFGAGGALAAASTAAGTIAACVAGGAGVGAAIVLAITAAPFGFLAGSTLARSIGSRSRARELESAARAWFDSVPLARAKDAGEGRVRLAGVARPLRLAPSWSRSASVASSFSYTDSRGMVHTLAEGGEFELDDGSGVRVVVHARYVAVLEGVRRDRELIVPPEARVEVVGTARSGIASQEARSRGGMRDAARVIEIDGTPEDPVMVRIARGA